MAEPTTPAKAENAQNGMPPEAEAVDEEHDFRNDMRRLVEDGRALFDAELRFHRMRLRYGAQQTRLAVYIGSIGIGFIVAATITLAVGALFALGPLIGRWWAMAVVASGCAILAVAMLAVAHRKLRRLIELLRYTSDEDEDGA